MPLSPLKRILLKASDALSEKKKEVYQNVTEVAPAGSEGILCHTVWFASNGSNHCHAFARNNSSNDDMMTAIEYNWNMARGTLYLDSRWNCFWCVGTHHTQFDGGKWCLMPDMKILKAFEDAFDPLDRSKLGDALQAFDGQISTYTFLALSTDIQGQTILRRHRHIAVPQDILADNDIGKWPFDEEPFCKIKSHLHPKFLILSLGELLSKRKVQIKALDELEHLADYMEHFQIIVRLHDQWTHSLAQHISESFNEVEEVIEEAPTPEKKKRTSRTSNKATSKGSLSQLSAPRKPTEKGTLRGGKRVADDHSSSIITRTTRSQSRKRKQFLEELNGLLKESGGGVEEDDDNVGEIQQGAEGEGNDTDDKIVNIGEDSSSNIEENVEEHEAESAEIIIYNKERSKRPLPPSSPTTKAKKARTHR